MRHFFLIFFLLVSFIAGAQKLTTRFEQSNSTQTPDYFEIIDWWKKLDLQSGKIKMLTMGITDAGYPLHLVVVSNNGDYNFSNIRKNNKRIILINNGIHPGEPDGIDASMLLARDIVAGKYKIPDNIVLAIIPVYNIGGCLNRSANYRVDQNGPEEFGFRGNSQNLDLNRDFIKCDSRDARAFTEIFHLTDPDVFVDNHVSNGADYQHVMTLLTTQNSKLGGTMGEYISKEFEPALYSLMKTKGFDLIPYVNSFGDTPENGWPEYWDSPRYASGYAALWHTFSFVPESHMLKPYDQRVKATYALMQSFIEFTKKNSEQIKSIRNQTNFAPKTIIKKPKAYVIPQGWWKVIELLKLNKVQMSQLKKDTIIEAEVYKIEDYKTTPRQYEMHHLNSDVKTTTTMQTIRFLKGDWYIPMNQPANRFLMETLEPQAEDSYFAWNYFDAILGQKEGYSAYVFEDIAAGYLKNNTELKVKLEQRKQSDTAFAGNARAQLNFVYQNSSWYEPAHMRYPVYRILK